jgi:hypothetical protein
MERSLIIIILIMSMSGILGGLVNFYILDEKNNKIYKSILFGLAASLMVPLFLNMISSNLLEQIRGSESKPGDPLKIFVFAGFCLVASIYSRKFIQTISDSVLKEINKIAQKKVSYGIEPILDRETEIDQPDEMRNIEELPEEQRRILIEMAKGKYVLRTIRGISKATDLKPESVKQVINELLFKGLVRQRDREGGPRWFITLEGRKNVPNN